MTTSKNYNKSYKKFRFVALNPCLAFSFMFSNNPVECLLGSSSPLPRMMSMCPVWPKVNSLVLSAPLSNPASI